MYFNPALPQQVQAILAYFYATQAANNHHQNLGYNLYTPFNNPLQQNSEGWRGSHLLPHKVKIANPNGSKGASVPISWKEKNGQIYGTAKVAKGSSLTDIPHGFILQKKGPNGWENVASAA